MPDPHVSVSADRDGLPLDGGPHLELRAHDLPAGRVVRGRHLPGWHWHEHVGRAAGLEVCPRRHVGVVETGRLAVSLGAGATTELGPGDVFDIPPGHDAWVIGDEPCVFVDFGQLGAAPGAP